MYKHRYAPLSIYSNFFSNKFFCSLFSQSNESIFTKQILITLIESKEDYI